MNKMKKAFTTPTSLDRELEPSPVMKESVTAVEKIVGYSFKNKRLLEEALTHSSFPWSTSYQRLEVLGDSVLNHAVTNYFFCMADRRKFNQDQITKLRSANAGNLKLARVAVRLGLYPYLRRFNTPVLDDKIFKPLLEPIYTLEDLRGRPMAILYDFCLKNGWRLEIKLKPRDETENISIAGVYVDDVLVGSGSSKGNSNAKQNAAKEAVHKLSQSMVVNNGSFEGIPAGNDRSFRIEEAIQMLHVLCAKKRLPKPPEYKNETIGVNRGANPGLQFQEQEAPRRSSDYTESALYQRLEFIGGDAISKIRGLVELIVTLEDLQDEPQPVTMLFDLC
ncbi:hypothetical protein GBA52_014408 [Prunus armeniaca]|nr:hypothetical protein GBA52_014408 [Prunus armeniaca]